MFSNRVFQIAFLVSLVTHGVILSQSLSGLSLFSSRKKEDKLKISYIKQRPEIREPQKIPEPKKDPFPKKTAKIIAGKSPIPPPFIDKDTIFKRNGEINILAETAAKPILASPDIIAIKKKITLPPIDIDKINNPSYVSYYQIVREKIRRAAYQNYARNETGEVYLSFIISGDGDLREVRLVEEKSSPNAYLRGISLKSIRDASPFPNFPKALDYPHLSFNVVISFEIE